MRASSTREWNCYVVIWFSLLQHSPMVLNKWRIRGPTACRPASSCPSPSFWAAGAVVCLVSRSTTQGSHQQPVDDKSSAATFIQNRMETHSCIVYFIIPPNKWRRKARRYALNVQPRGGKREGRGIDGWQELSTRIGLNLTASAPPKTERVRNWQKMRGKKNHVLLQTH